MIVFITVQILVKVKILLVLEIWYNTLISSSSLKNILKSSNLLSNNYYTPI